MKTSNSQTRSCGTSNIGACSYGVQTCTNRQWGNCVGEISPSSEICSDQLDNDCDGTVDEWCNATGVGGGGGGSGGGSSGGGTSGYFTEGSTMFYNSVENLTLVEINQNNVDVSSINGSSYIINEGSSEIISGLNVSVNRITYNSTGTSTAFMTIRS